MNVSLNDKNGDSLISIFEFCIEVFKRNIKDTAVSFYHSQSKLTSFPVNQCERTLNLPLLKPIIYVTSDHNISISAQVND